MSQESQLQTQQTVKTVNKKTKQKNVLSTCSVFQAFSIGDINVFVFAQIKLLTTLSIFMKY